ncbi:MAG: histidinol-phosphatase HisJ family protein [Oscillibacter sp.]|nr:histidinol-phosphatase HisJ family protein [Oscillibacter sp.]
MYLADYHTHSRISQDARYPMTDMAEAAVAAGLDELCFTDHIEPIIWYSTELRQEPIDWAAMTAEFAAAEAAVGDRIRLRLGIELGDAMWSFAHTEKLLSDAPELDFVIGSVHTLSETYGGIDLYLFEPKSEQEARAGMRDYLEQVYKMAKWGKFSVLGHLTLPLRYLNEYRGFSLTYDGFESEIEDIFRVLLERGCGIEVNTNRGNAPLPGEKWLKMYRRLGGEVITLGTDAHTPEFVGCAIRERQQLLRDCGFKRFCTFEKMRPIFHEL